MCLLLFLVTPGCTVMAKVMNLTESQTLLQMHFGDLFYASLLDILQHVHTEKTQRINSLVIQTTL